MPRIPPWLLLMLLVLYVLSPIDLLPDVLGLPGRLDDFLVAAAGLLYLHRIQRSKSGRKEPAGAGRNRDGAGRPTGDQPETPGSADQAAGRSGDPYEVLGLSPETSFEEIRRRYKEQLLLYHPDRVQHLGREFQELAEQRTRELNAAFEEVLRKQGPRG